MLPIQYFSLSSCPLLAYNSKIIHNFSFAACKTQAHKHAQNKTQKGARNRTSKKKK